MKIYPALDLIDGKYVRLTQGSFDKQTVYGDDPVKMAQKFRNSGAEYLHLVDLQGTKTPSERQIELIKDIVDSSGLKVEFGGGIRSKDDVSSLLALGVDRVIIGSLAISAPDKVRSILDAFGPKKVVIAVDFRVKSDGEPMVALHGWQEESALSVWKIINSFLGDGLSAVLATDIQLDGMLKGPNVAFYSMLRTRFPSLEIIASGGVSSIDDIKMLKGANIDSLVIGKALYEQKINLSEALNC